MLQTAMGGLTQGWITSMAGLSDGRLILSTATLATSAGENNNVPVTASVIYVTTTNDLDSITGMGLTDASATIAIVVNASIANNLVLKNQSGSSLAANRIMSPQGSDYVVSPLSVVLVSYDTANAIWRILRSHDSASSGAIKMFGGAAAPPNWLLCNGAAVSRAAYPGLFTAIGTTYGAGDASTTFNLPDLRQRFPLGKATSGTGSALGGTGGLIDHLHTVDPPSTTSGVPSATTTGISLIGAGTAGSGTHTHDLDIAQFNSGTGNPPFQTVNFIIKI